jgi:hypothetical protein
MTVIREFLANDGFGFNFALDSKDWIDFRDEDFFGHFFVFLIIFVLYPFGIRKRDTSRAQPCGDPQPVCQLDIRVIFKKRRELDCRASLAMTS